MSQDDMNTAEPRRRTALDHVESRIDGSATPERRGVLKGLAAATAGLLGFSGSVTASDNQSWETAAAKVAQEYASEAAVRGAISEHSSELFRALANDGYITHGDVSKLSMPVHWSPAAYAHADAGVGVFTIAGDDGPRAKIQIKQPTSDGHRLVIHVIPDSGESRASLVDEKAGESKRLALDTTGPRSGVTVQDCCYGAEEYCRITCSPDGNCSCINYRVCYQNSDDPCDCEVLGYSCSGCSKPGGC